MVQKEKERANKKNFLAKARPPEATTDVSEAYCILGKSKSPSKTKLLSVFTSKEL